MPFPYASTISPSNSTFSSFALMMLLSGGSRGAPEARPDLLLDDAHVLCLRAFLALLEVELDVRALRKRLEPLALQRAEVDENVLASVARGDESEPLRVVEPLNGSGCHLNSPPSAI